MNHLALDRLNEVLGAEGLLLPHQDLARYEREWRGRFASSALAVARPASTGQLARVVAICAEMGLSMVPQGGNTGLVGGAVACGERAQLIVSLERMRRIIRLDADSASLTLEAGCTLEQAAAAAACAGFRLPLALASGGSATIGGILATNAGGNETIRFGTARTMVLGLEAVFANGQVWNGLSAPRKNNSGYHLAQLLVGSEGTLAIITAATLALKPLPQQIETAWLALRSPQAALAVLRRVRRNLGEMLTAFELIPRQALEFLRADPAMPSCPVDWQCPWHVLIECDTETAGHWLRPALLDTVDAAFRADEVVDGVLAENGAQQAGFWRLREGISHAQGRGGVSIKHDIALPTALIPEFIETCLSELEASIPGIRPCVFGHLGDGSLHFNLSQPEQMAAADFRALECDINERVFARVLAAGGSIAAEHGIGLLRRERLAQSAQPAALEAMKQIKQALDPLGLLNPGKVLARD